MDISKIPIGHNPPSDMNVIIEIIHGALPVKYELDKASVALFVEANPVPKSYPALVGFAFTQPLIETLPPTRRADP
jgi:inorganic pyrophosphatase